MAFSKYYTEYKPPQQSNRQSHDLSGILKSLMDMQSGEQKGLENVGGAYEFGSGLFGQNPDENSYVNQQGEVSTAMQSRSPFDNMFKGGGMQSPSSGGKTSGFLGDLEKANKLKMLMKFAGG